MRNLSRNKIHRNGSIMHTIQRLIPISIISLHPDMPLRDFGKWVWIRCSRLHLIPLQCYDALDCYGATVGTSVTTHHQSNLQSKAGWVKKMGRYRNAMIIPLCRFCVGFHLLIQVISLLRLSLYPVFREGDMEGPLMMPISPTCSLKKTIAGVQDATANNT